MRLALVHDWLNQRGGAEDVLEALVATYPSAPIFTSIFWREKMPASYLGWDIRTTWLDRAPAIYRHHRPYLPLYPIAFGGLDLSRYDVVLSNKSGFCHGVRTGKAMHICYCLAPTRYVWEFDTYTQREALPWLAKIALRPLLGLLRNWDYRAAQRVTHFVAISRAVRDRIQSVYGRDSVVISPPVNTAAFPARASVRGGPRSAGGMYYLIVSRLVAYRRLDEAVRAFNSLGRRLVVAGEGPDRERLEAMAAPNVSFLGRVPDDELTDLFAGCEAYVVPGEEDFGIAPVQAQAAGRPVIAFAGGGALDTVLDGVTGKLYLEAGAEALAEAVSRFEAHEYDPEACRNNAARFSTDLFMDRIVQFIEHAVTGTGSPHRVPALDRLGST